MDSLQRLATACRTVAPLCALCIAPLAAALAELPGSELAAELRARGLEPARLVIPTRVTPKMKAWVHANVPAKLPEVQRVFRLHDALTEPWGLDLRQTADYTGTAEEAFASGTCNCLSFAFLFTTLARELGISTQYVGVDVAPLTERHDCLRVRSEHIAVAVGEGRRRIVLDCAGSVNQATHPRSEVEVLAMFYSNRGAELLIDSQDSAALEWLENAVVLDPGRASNWLNLGVARRRNGDFDGAEVAYRRALEIDPQDAVAKENLTLLLLLRDTSPPPP